MKSIKRQCWPGPLFPLLCGCAMLCTDDNEMNAKHERQDLKRGSGGGGGVQTKRANEVANVESKPFSHVNIQEKVHKCVCV